ncbi:MAG: flagellar biosynthetic protein FliO [Lachnospiraceae bacterium]|nr:flagellar biosynthetic protein FliO [Lachnospiraceae bacterium]
MKGYLLTLGGTAAGAAAPAGSAVNNIARFLTLLLIFVFVLAVTVYTTRFVAKTQQGRSRSANMELLETLALGNGKYLQMVRIGEQYVVLAVGKDSVAKVAELPAEAYVKTGTAGSGGFGEILKRVGMAHAQKEADGTVQEPEQEKE